MTPPDPAKIRTDPSLRLFSGFRPITKGFKSIWVVPGTQCLKPIAAKQVQKRPKKGRKGRFGKTQ